MINFQYSLRIGVIRKKMDFKSKIDKLMVSERVNDNAEKCRPKYLSDKLKAEENGYGLEKEARKTMKSEKVTIKKGCWEFGHWAITKLSFFPYQQIAPSNALYTARSTKKINFPNEEQYFRIHCEFSPSIDE